MKLNVPNMITLFRLILALFVFYLLSSQKQNYYFFCFGATLIIVFLDHLDGFFARILKQETSFGSWFDIAIDRIIEISYFIIFACNSWINVFVPILFVIRGILVDGIRGFAQAQGLTAFGDKSMMKSKLGSFLVSSRFSRALYGLVKVLAFSLIILCQIEGFSKFITLANICVNLSVIMCIIRGLPVLIEGSVFLKN